MRTATVIDKAALEELYGKDSVGAKSNLGSPHGNFKSLSGVRKEKIEVRPMDVIGPYSVVKTEEFAGNYGLIVPSSLLETVSVKDNVEVFTEALEKLHKGRWAYINNHIYILYPKLEITNSLKLKHTIYDLLVKFEITSFSVGHPQGTRLSWTNNELACKYAHSHLPKGMFGMFEYFCIGGGSRFSKLLQDLQKPISLFEAELFLLQLEEYLKWESVEGKPYISISYISNKVTLSSDDVGAPHRNSTYLKELAVEMLKEVTASMLIKAGTFYLLSPSKGFYDIEKKVVASRMDNVPLDILQDFDEVKMQYVGTGIQNVVSPHYDTYCSRFMTIIPGNYGLKVIDENNNPTVMKRLKKSCVNYIITEINMLLVAASQTTINDQRCNIEAQAEGSANKESGTTDSIPTQSVS